jgi:hypothetical protein
MSGKLGPNHNYKFKNTNFLFVFLQFLSTKFWSELEALSVVLSAKLKEFQDWIAWIKAKKTNKVYFIHILFKCDASLWHSEVNSLGHVQLSRNTLLPRLWKTSDLIFVWHFFKNILAMFDEIYSSILQVWNLTFFPVPPPLRCSRWCSTLSGDSHRSSPSRCWTEQRCGTWSNRRLNKLINLSFIFHWY